MKKQKRFYPSDIVIPAVAAGLIALLLTQWQRLPRRVTPGGLIAEAALWPRENEEALGVLSETTQPGEWLDCASDLADIYGMMGRHQEEEELLEKCLVVRDKHYRPEANATLKLVNTLADIYRLSGRPAKALPLQLRALGTKGQDADKVNRERLVEAAASQRALGLYTDAEALLRRALLARGWGAEAMADKRKDVVWQKWLQEYREVLALTGKQPEEIEQTMFALFGL